MASKDVPIIASYTHPRRTVYVDRPALVEALEHDSVANRVLNTLSCELYHSYGWSLAPAKVLTTTIKHTHFIDEVDGGTQRDSVSTGRESTGRE